MRIVTDYLLRKLLFRPVKLAVGHRYHFDAPFQERWFDTPDGERLNTLYFPAVSQPSQGVVFYFHGNRDHLQRWGAYHGVFNRMGYDFFIPDYRGYGKSSGTPDEAPFFEDADLLFDWVGERYPANRIILYGRSMGTGVATYLAARRQAAGLVLETPFNHIKGLLSSHLGSIELPFEPSLRFPNHEHLKQTKMPVLIFHGTRDRVVPYASAADLKNYLKPEDRFITIEGGSHHNLGHYPAYQTALEQWFAQVSNKI